MRKLILDTETTGLDPDRDRIIEVACLEILNDTSTDIKYHSYFNPDGIIISKEAEEIHGLNNSVLNQYKRLLENNSYDIVWHVKKVKTITLLKKDYKSLPNLKRLAKISENNPHINRLNNIINRESNIKIYKFSCPYRTKINQQQT